MKELIRNRLRNQFEWSKLTDKNMATKTHALLTTIGYLVAFVMVLGYAISLPYQMNQELQLDKVNPYVVSLLFWVLGIWTLLSGVKHLLVGADHDQLFVLPIEEWQAKLVNIISLYIIYLFLCGVILFSIQIPLYLFQPFSLINLLIVGIFVIMTPLLAIGSSMIVSLVIKLILFGLNFRNTLIEAVLTLFIFISPLLYGYLKVPFDVKSGVINTSLLTVSLLDEVGGNDWLKIILLFGVVLLVFGGLCLVIVKKYNQLTTLVGVQLTVVKRYTLEIQSTLTALLKKEINRYFSSFTYVVNTIISPIALFVIAAGLSMGLLPRFSPITIDVINLTIPNSAIYFAIFVVCLTLTTTTSCSFSFEGKNVWVIQSLPISVNELSVAKGLLNILLFIPGLVVAAIACWSALELRGIDFIIHVVFLLTSLLCISFLGLAINLKFPNFNWSNEMVVVKQGMSTIITGVVSMVLISLSVVLYLFLGTLGIGIVAIAELLIVGLSTIQIRKINYLQGDV
jgi:ABC-2 type transport system permease protein